MAINRRRAASSAISSAKKLSGHKNEDVYASLIEGRVIKGTQKGDVSDQKDFLYSVKSGKKWQIFLYGHDRISQSSFLNILEPCLEAFPANAEKYFQDRVKCIEFKEAYILKHGKELAKNLTNETVSRSIGKNEYVDSKTRLAKATRNVAQALEDKGLLRSFLSEAIFNNSEVTYLAAKDSTFMKDNVFKTFHRNDVLDVFTSELSPSTSNAGHNPQDFNVPGQKTLLRYSLDGAGEKNLVEIEIRNDSPTHYRQVRFNMYSKDALTLLHQNLEEVKLPKLTKGVAFFGKTSK
jgi:hypothetical protein